MMFQDIPHSRLSLQQAGIIFQVILGKKAIKIFFQKKQKSP